MSVPLDLPSELATRLSRLAALAGRSEQDCVLDALNNYLDDLEDGLLAMRELEEIRAGRSIPVPLAEVMREYGLDR